MLRTLLLASLIAFSLVACGNKGPLVLPDQKPPASQSKDKDKNPPAGTAQPAPAAGGGASGN